MRRSNSTSLPSSSSSSSSSSTSLVLVGAGVTVLTGAAAALYFHHQYHNSPKRRAAREEEAAYLAALHHIALSAGAARQAQVQHQDDNDETRYARRQAFFTRFFQDVMGGDQAQYKFVHVAGTKGKGTVCELVRCGLIAHGKRVGTFTSPHLHTVRERIRVNDAMIPKAAFVRLWATVQEALETEPWAMFFDKVLALALAYFVEQRVEYVVLEVGIGGRYDPTNFIAAPGVCVVTSVSQDHTELLGTTLEEIAWQKAGIMKAETVCLTGAGQDARVLDVLRKEAERTGCFLDEVGVGGPSSNASSSSSSSSSSC